MGVANHLINGPSILLDLATNSSELSVLLDLTGSIPPVHLNYWTISFHL